MWQTEGGRGDLWLAGVTQRWGERSCRGCRGSISTPCPVSTLQFTYVCVYACVIDPFNPVAIAIDPNDRRWLCACLYMRECVCVCLGRGWGMIRLPWRQARPWTLPLPLNIYKGLANQNQAETGHQPRHAEVHRAWVFMCFCLCVSLDWLHTISPSQWTHKVKAHRF